MRPTTIPRAQVVPDRPAPIAVLVPSPPSGEGWTPPIMPLVMQNQSARDHIESFSRSRLPSRMTVFRGVPDGRYGEKSARLSRAPRRIRRKVGTRAMHHSRAEEHGKELDVYRQLLPRHLNTRHLAPRTRRACTLSNCGIVFSLQIIRRRPMKLVPGTSTELFLTVCSSRILPTISSRSSSLYMCSGMVTAAARASMSSSAPAILIDLPCESIPQDGCTGRAARTMPVERLLEVHH